VPNDGTNAQKRLMLLADHFTLTSHRETRQLPVFALVMPNAERLGPQLRRHPNDTTCEADAPEVTSRAAAGPFEQAWVLVRNTPCGRIAGGIVQNDRSQAWAGGRRITVDRLAASLGELTPLDLPAVLDQTGLEGEFDFVLVWNPQIQELSNAPEAAGLTFPQALREQLGLRLQRQTGAVEVIVVDRVERPMPD